MSDTMLLENLMSFGLTRQEAVLYLALYQNGTQTGYEVSKLTGVSRSNAYNGLSGLVDKGAAYVAEGKAKKYASVDIGEFCNNKLRLLAEKKKYLIGNMQKKKEESEGYITITGDDNIIDKVHNMIIQANKRVYISMSAVLLEKFLPEISWLAESGMKAVILTNKPVYIEGIQIFLTEDKKNQIGLITDSSYALIGELGNKKESVCLYSGQKNFVRVYKDSLRNEIKLLELTKGEHLT